MSMFNVTLRETVEYDMEVVAKDESEAIETAWDILYEEPDDKDLYFSHVIDTDGSAKEFVENGFGVV